MLTIDKLCCGYNKKEILHQLSLSVEARETLVVMGPSGSGKSTLLLALLGILTPTSGTIWLNDRDISTLAIEQRNIGYLPQDYGLFPHLNVEENIAFGLKMRGMARHAREERVHEMLSLVELKGYEKRSPLELSGGEKQRAGLARALAVSPSLLLLDEPLSNIDPVTKNEVANSLKSLFHKLEIPIILVTHFHREAEFFAQKLAILEAGKIAQIDTYKAIAEHPNSEFIHRLMHSGF